MLNGGERQTIVDYRIEKAWKTLQEAKDNAKMNHWNLTGNRLYYAAYHMASALLIKNAVITKTHAGVIHQIGEKFIAKGIISKDYGRFFSQLFELRQSGDYDDTFDATKEQIMPYFEKTEAFLNDLEKIIRQ